jgi:hypothetical protein
MTIKHARGSSIRLGRVPHFDLQGQGVPKKKDILDIAAKKRMMRRLGLGQSKFSNLQFRRTKIDEQTMFHSASSKVPEELGGVFIGKGLTSFEFNY